MATIFHIAVAAEWEAARTSGEYATSTRGSTLAEVGFIHCSRGDQWTKVRDAFYADVTEPLVLLQIDTELLDVPVVDEPSEPGSSETFPHIYGPLPTTAVVKAIPLLSPGAAAAEPTETAERSGSFTRVFFTEMFVNLGLVLLIMAATAAGLGIGTALGEEVAPLIGLCGGLLLGAVAARRLYVRRHAVRA